MISRGPRYSEGNATFQIEATAEELMNLMGFSGYSDKEALEHLNRESKRHDDHPKRLHSVFSVGDEIKVAEMYKLIHEIKSNSKKLAEYGAKLKAAASLVEDLPDTFENLHVGPDLKEEEDEDEQ